MAPIRRIILSTAVALLMSACFEVEEPIEERLRIMPSADGSVHLRLSVRLSHLDESDSVLGRRLQKIEEDVLAGQDPWARRFGSVPAVLENAYWEKEEGRLIYVERHLLLESFDPLDTLLDDTPILASFEQSEDVSELALFPGLPDRASRRERREMDEVLDRWAVEVTKYLNAAADLYGYLEERPQRARVVFAAIFEEETSEDPLTPEEDRLVEALGDHEVIEVLSVDADRGESLEELSRRVFDPFPARFEIEPPFTAIETEGFVRSDDAWVVPGLSLWTALTELEGMWVAPDPLLAWVRHQRATEDVPFDVAGFAARPRVAKAADADDVYDALIEKLTPADVYRVTWPSSEAAAARRPAT